VSRHPPSESSPTYRISDWSGTEESDDKQPPAGYARRASVTAPWRGIDPQRRAKNSLEEGLRHEWGALLETGRSDSPAPGHRRSRDGVLTPFRATS